jgi:hypothetical protein
MKAQLSSWDGMSSQSLESGKKLEQKVDSETMVQHDEDVVTLIMVCWTLSKAHFSSDVMEYIEKCLEDSGMPRLATRNVSEGL